MIQSIFLSEAMLGSPYVALEPRVAAKQFLQDPPDPRVSAIYSHVDRVQTPKSSCGQESARDLRVRRVHMR